LPFEVALPFGVIGSGFFFVLDAAAEGMPLFGFTAVRPLICRFLPAAFGLLLRVLALFSKLESELSSSS